MIIIAGTIEFEDEKHRDTALEQSRPLQQATRDDEPGCLAYCFAADPCVPNRIQVYELWKDEPSLMAHFTHHTYLEMVEVLNSVGIRETENQMYLIDKHKSVYDEDGNPRTVLFGDE